MSPVILEYLTETLRCDTLPLTRFSHDRLLQFLDENLIFLRDSLIPANFDRALTTLWSTSARVISSTIEEGIQEKCPQSHFSRLYHIFRVLINFFFGESHQLNYKSFAIMLFFWQANLFPRTQAYQKSTGSSNCIRAIPRRWFNITFQRD